MTYNSTTPAQRRPMRQWINEQVALPADILDEEVTYILLFRLSVLLNRMTGGHRDMTFSARTRLEYQQRRWAARWCWGALQVAIDLYCRTARGEVGHCAVALRNYHRRCR